MIPTVLKPYGSYLLAGIAVIILASSCYLTYTVTDSRWQSKWDTRESEISKASAKATEEARNKELEYQRSIDAIRSEGAASIAAATADAADASAASDRLLKRLNAILADQAASVASGAPRGKTATQAINMLANVLEKSIDRNRQLAKIADDNYERGLICEKGWDSLVKNQSN